ncbi:MAG: hypothetical protein EBV03_08385 [Proteobacteria bacterium]|nr:hypothetical protein [Pseudomonadota bacterium]
MAHLLPPVLAGSAILSYLLLGYVLVSGRSWGCMLPTLVWLPASAWSLAHFATTRQTGPRWMFLTALVLGAVYHGSHPQDASYVAMFWGMGMLWLMACDWRQALPHIRFFLASACMGIGLALIVIVPQYLEMADVPRDSAGTDTLAGTFLSMLLPSPLVKSRPVFGYRGGGYLYYSGTVFIVGFLLQCAWLAMQAARGHVISQQRRLAVFSLLGIFAYVYALGPATPLWRAMLVVPGFSKFSWSFRLFPFAVFFMTVAGAVFLAQRLQARPRVQHALGGLVAVLLLYNMSMPLYPFWRWGDAPYPQLPPQLHELQAEGFTTVRRGWSHGAWRSHQGGYVLTMLHNYPMLYNIPVRGGYVGGTIEFGMPISRKLSELEQRDIYRFYEEYAIGWMSVPKLELKDWHRVKDTRDWLEGFNGRVINTDAADFYFIDTPDTKPMAFDVAAPETPLPYKLLSNGFIVDTQQVTSENADVAMAFVYRPWFVALDAQGRQLHIIADDMMRMHALMEGATEFIRMEYRPPWWLGFSACGIFTLLGLGIWVFGGRMRVRD